MLLNISVRGRTCEIRGFTRQPEDSVKVDATAMHSHAAKLTDRKCLLGTEEETLFLL